MTAVLRAVAALLCSLAAMVAMATGTDPLDSPQWEFMHRTILHGEPVVFDDRVEVTAPLSAEDALNVPVLVRAESLPDIDRIVVFADLNPIHKVLVFHPGRARAVLGFRIKIEQATPIRAAARTRDGVWHVGGQWVDAAGGGCTAPSYGRTSGTWFDTLGQVRYRRWAREDDDQRLRFQVMHPMDTGLAPGIPAFYIERLEIHDDEEALLATLELYEPVSENPWFTLDLPGGQGRRPVTLSGRDINGNRIGRALD